MSESTTIREAFNLRVTEAEAVIQSAHDALWEVPKGDMEGMDAAIATLREAEAVLAGIKAEESSLAEAEAEAADAEALAKAIRQVFNRNKRDARDFTFSIDGEAFNVTFKKRATRTGGNIGQRSTLTFSVDGKEAVSVSDFMKEYGDVSLDNAHRKTTKKWDNNVTHPEFYAAVVARLRKEGRTVILTEGEHPAVSHSDAKVGYAVWLEKHTARLS